MAWAIALGLVIAPVGIVYPAFAEDYVGSGTVTISSGEYENVYGVYSSSGTASGSTVTISQDEDATTTITGSVYGNYTASGTATSTYDSTAYTAVTISGGTFGVETTDENNNITIVGGEVYGNYSGDGAVTGTGTMDTPDVLISGGAIYNNVYGGYTAGEADATYNYVYVSGGVIGTAEVTGVGNVYGGYSVGGNASYNAVTLTENAKLDEHVFGGYSVSGSATNNVVTVSGSAELGIYSSENDSSGYTSDVYGGYSESSSASYNYVYLYDSGQVDGDVFGGYGSTEVSYNVVTAYDSSNVTGNIHGGHTGTASATVSNNSVILTENSKVEGWAIGGFSETTSTVTNNYVTLEDSAYATVVYGGLSYEGTTTNNTVTITGGGATYVWGGQGGVATGNVVLISGKDTVIEYPDYPTASQIAGGYATSGAADNNTVTIEDDATFTGYAVYGGWGQGASGNSVTISDTDNVAANVYANNAYSGDATGSDGTGVTIEDATVAGNVYGGYSASGGEVTGNSVVIGGSAITENTDMGSEGSIYGGYISGSTSTSAVSENEVTITDSSVSGSVYGGYTAGSGNAASNSVLLGDGDDSVTVSGDVYGGYSASGSTSGNAVSIYGSVVVTGSIYGGTSEDKYDSTDTDAAYNSLWVQGIGNKAAVIGNFGTITFDIDEREDDDVMLTLTTESLVDLTGSYIDVYNDDESVAITPGAQLILIDATSSTEGIEVTEANLAELDDVEYVLDGDYDSSLVVDDAYLEGTYTREITVTDSDGNVVTADDDGILSGANLVLAMGDTVTVEKVFFDLGEDSDDDSSSDEYTYEWATSRITLEDGVNYDFSSSPTITGVNSAITLTDDDEDSFTGTLIYDSETSVLMDGTSAASVLDIDTVDLSDYEEAITYTYVPAAGITVTGTASLVTLDSDESGTDESFALESVSIDSVTFEDVEYDSENAPVVLVEGCTYDMSETTIDVSALNLVDTDGETVDISYEDDGSMETGQIVMTLIDAAGGVTNLDENSGLPAEGDDANNQAFGYTLTGVDDATLEGTLAGYVTYDEDDSGVDGSYDLVLIADTSVTVGDVDLDVSDSIEWDNSTRITLNSALSYDFSESTLVDFPDELTITGNAISGTMLANGEATVLIDTNGAEYSSMSVLADQVSTTYTYTPATGVTVTGSAKGVEGSLELEIEDVNEVTFASIVYDEDEAPVVLKDDIEDDESYDLSETVINVDDLALIDSDGNTVEITYDDSVITEEDGHEVMTLIYANGMSSGLLENGTLPKDTSLTFGYELSDTATASDSTLSGTLAGVVAARSDDSLILKTGTEVSVSDVTLDIETLDWDSDALLTLNSVLSYDFDPVESVSVSEETAIDTDSFLDVGSLKTLIDGESAVAVNGMSNLEGYESSYSYSLLGGVVQVTGTGSTSVSDSGNSLNYAVSNIATMDFYIDEDTPTDEPILEVESADLSGTEVTAHAEGGSYLEPGYEITLLSTDEGGLTTDGDTTYASVIEGVSIEYELEVGREDDTIIAKIEGESSSSSTPKLREETKSIPATRLAQTAIIDQGMDALVFAFDDALRVAREKTKWTPFVAMDAGDFDYSIGGSLDIESFNGTVGLLRNVFDDKGIFSYGPLFQYGKADYDTHVNGVYADGDAEHVGGGLFFRRRWYEDNWCLEGAITGGYSQADYSSNSLLEGSHTTYDVGSKYISTYLGLLKEFELSNDRMLQLYTKYFYSHLDSSDAYLSSGEKYYFDDVDSSRLRLGAKFFWNMNKDDYRFQTYVGAAYQYQFEGTAVGIYNGISTLTPDMSGGSGILEGGIIYNPKDSDMTVNLGVAGWFGAQEGIEGRLLLKWDL